MPPTSLLKKATFLQLACIIAATIQNSIWQAGIVSGNAADGCDRTRGDGPRRFCGGKIFGRGKPVISFIVLTWRAYGCERGAA